MDQQTTEPIEQQENVLQEKGVRICSALIDHMELVAQEVAEAYSNDIDAFLADLSYLWAEISEDLAEKLKAVLRHTVLLGVLSDVALKQRDNYFLLLNELFAPPVQAADLPELQEDHSAN